jgi:phage N-6-adenine-methyltransferase
MSELLVFEKPELRLALYEAAKAALLAACTTDEVTSVLDRAKAMEFYAKIAGDSELSRQATEIRLRAEKRLGEMMAEQKATVGMAPAGRPKIGSVADPIIPTLADAGIDKHLADRARKAAAMPEEQYEAKIARQIALAEAAASATGKAAHPKSEFTGEVEWYTPPEYIDLARKVMGGVDLDPASSDKAQVCVQAKSYFTVADDGLTKEWNGAVWLNPPYKQPHIFDFAVKMVKEVQSGRVTQAIMLTHNYSDTEWFQLLASECVAICFTRGRVKFVDSYGEVAAPTQGQAFFCFGNKPAKFAKAFSKIGLVVRPW